MTYLLAALTFAFLTRPLWSQTDEPIALSAGTGDVVLPDIVSISSVAKSRPHQSGGSGVALPIAKRVDDVHGGRIHAKNRTSTGLRVALRLSKRG